LLRIIPLIPLQKFSIVRGVPMNVFLLIAVSFIFVHKNSLAYSVPESISEKVKVIFQNNCFVCHNAQKPKGGLDLENFDQVNTKYAELFDFSNPENSILYQQITGVDPAMPQGKNAKPLSKNETDLVLEWIKTGAKGVKENELTTNESDEQSLDEYAYAQIAEFLTSVPKAQQRQYRFLSLLPYSSTLSSGEMDELAAGLNKYVNSISLAPQLFKLKSIGEVPGLFAFRLPEMGRDAVFWQSLINLNYPYPINLGSNTSYVTAKLLTKENQPLLRADWFVHTTSQGENYYNIMKIPKTLLELESSLGVNVIANVASGEAMRAGFANSGVSQHNRVIERHELSQYSGYYWRSFDFASSERKQNIFANPRLGSDPSIEQLGAFDSACGEMIWSLPNGMQAYMLTDGSGKRIDKGPTDIVQDDQRRDAGVINAISCMSCHSEGIKIKADEVLSFYQDIPQISANGMDQLKTIYVGNDIIQPTLKKDQENFLRGLNQLGDHSWVKNEPVLELFKLYEQDVNLDQALTELGLSLAEMNEAITSPSFPLDKQVIINQLKRGGVKRQVFEKEFKALQNLKKNKNKKNNSSIQLLPKTVNFDQVTEKLITNKADGAHSVFAIDLDNDGDQDVLSASTIDDKIAWYENLGNGEFSSQKIISNNADRASSVFASDLDNDGDQDVLSASTIDDKIAWYKNLGNGEFSSQKIISKNADGANSVFAIDLDNDGDQDVLSASQNDDKIAWYENLGNENFSDQKIISKNADEAISVFAIDLDNDGNQDVLSASMNDDKIAWYKNLGNGEFSSQKIISDLADRARSVFASDLDNDGDQDVLSASIDDDKIAWYENLGNGAFSSQKIISNNADGARTVFAIDLDNDGDQDVLSASLVDDKIAWYENLGNRNFSDQKIISNNSSGARSVFAIDLDNDGDQDVLGASETGDKITWYENQ
jgi:hypothetical protein